MRTYHYAKYSFTVLKAVPIVTTALIFIILYDRVVCYFKGLLILFSTRI